MAEDASIRHRARVFISYKRDNIKTAQKFRDALIHAGFDAFVDLHDIKPGEPWKERLGGLIATAEKLIFLISPQSVASNICDWEVNEAERQGKTVIPVVIQETAHDEIPPRLSRLNFIFARNDAEYATALPSLREAIAVDLDWERERTRINELAETWHSAGRPMRLLTWRDDAIRALEMWRDGHPATSPPPTEAQLAYVSESRLRFSKWQTLQRTGLAIVAIVTSAAAGVAYFQNVEANKQRQFAEEQQIEAERQRNVADDRRRDAELARLAEARERAKAERQERIALEERDRVMRNQSRALAISADSLRARGEIGKAVAVLVEALPAQLDAPAAPPYSILALKVLREVFYSNRELSVFNNHSSGILNAVFSQDDKRIITLSTDGDARIWSSKTGSEIGSLPKESPPIWSATWNPSEDKLLTTSLAGAQRWHPDGGEEVSRLGADITDLNYASWSPDGIRVLLESSGTSRIYSVDHPEKIVTLKRPNAETRLALWSPDGSLIATHSVNENNIYIWNSHTGALVVRLRSDIDTINSAAWSPDGSRFVGTSADGDARIWDARSGRTIAILSGHEDFIASVAWSRNGNYIATGSYDRTARVWDARSGQELAVLVGHSYRVVSVDWSPDGTHIVTASGDETARIWRPRLQPVDRPLSEDEGADAFNEMEAHQEATIAVLRGHTEGLTVARWSNDGSLIVTASSDGSARVWDARHSAKIDPLDGHTGRGKSTRFSPDGKRIAIASDDGSVRVWRLGSPADPLVLSGHSHYGVAARWSPDGKLLVTTSRGEPVRVWDASSGSEITSIRGGSPAWSADGAHLLIAAADGARVITTSDWSEVALLRGHQSDVQFVSMQLSGRELVTVSSDKTARVWSLTSRDELTVLRGHSDVIWDAIWSPDDSRILTRSRDGTIRIWNSSNGAEIAVLRGEQIGLGPASWSPDSTQVAAAYGRFVHIWDARTGNEIVVLRGHSSNVTSIAWRSDGGLVLTASDDRTARVWNPASASEIAVLRGHSYAVKSAVWSPDGAHVVTASFDEAWVWSYPTDQFLIDWAVKFSSKLDRLTKSDRCRLAIRAAEECIGVEISDQ